MSDIYCSEEIEALAADKEFDANVWADQFALLASLLPEMPTDRETMVSWFAAAIMAGYDRGRAA